MRPIKNQISPGLTSRPPAPPIQVDLPLDRVVLCDLKTPYAQVHHLEMEIPGLQRSLQKLTLSRIQELLGLVSQSPFPLRVQQMDVAVGREQANDFLGQLRVSHLEHLDVGIASEGRLKVQGQALSAIPFEVEGQLQADGSSRLGFELQGGKLGGLLPVPKVIMGLAAGLASQQLEQWKIQRQGSIFQADLASCLPASLEVGVDQIESSPGQLRLKKGQPGPAIPLGIQVDPEKEQVHLSQVNTSLGTIRSLELQVPGLDESLQRLSLPEIKALLELMGKAPFPLKLQGFQLSVSQDAANHLLEQQEIPGVSGLKVEVADQSRLKVNGRVQKGLRIPFEVEGQLQANGSSEVAFELRKTKLFGFLPIPGLLSQWMVGLAAQQMEELHVRQQGSRLLVDAGDFLPPQIQLGVDAIDSQAGQLHLRKER